MERVGCHLEDFVLYEPSLGVVAATEHTVSYAYVFFPFVDEVSTFDISTTLWHGCLLG